MILSGRIAPAARLPSSRVLAQELGVSRSTAIAAYGQLLSEGYIESRPRSQLIVSPELPERALQMQAPSPTAAEAAPARGHDIALPCPAKPFQPGAIDASLFPHESWARLMHRIWRKPRPELFAPASPAGWPPLRAAIAAHLRAWRGMDCHAGQIIVTSGTWDAIDLMARSVFSQGETVLMEDPGFPPVRRALADAGLDPLPVPADGDGLCFDPATAQVHRARGIHVTPSRQFPLGGTLPLARRLALLAWAETAGGFIIEDDFDSEYRYEGEPLPALMSLDGNGRVIYAGSFSKVMFPALRLGFLVVPEGLGQAFRERLRQRGSLASLICQPVLAEFMQSGAYAVHIRRTRRIYLSRRNALLAAAAACQDLLEMEPTSGGMHLVAWLSPSLAARMSDAEASAGAAQAGVTAVPLSAFYAGPARRSALLLGYAGFGEAAYPDAAERLASALR